MADQRDTLMKRAVAMGMDATDLQRFPTWRIEDLVKSNQARNTSSEERHDKHLNPEEEDVTSVLETSPAEVDPVAPAATVADDTQTEIDISFMQHGNNPSEQRYQRFEQLVAMKKRLTEAINTNTQVLERDRHRMDQEDIELIEMDLQHMQQQFQLVTQEQVELRRWFEDDFHQRESFYLYLKREMIDVSGHLKQHLDRKLFNIRTYMETINTNV